MPSAPPPRTPVFCKLSDCCYHEVDPNTNQVYCHHPDKAMNLRIDPCPLYRLDWKRRQAEMRLKMPRPR